MFCFTRHVEFLRVIHTNTEVSVDTTGCSAHRTVGQFDRQPFADHRVQPHEKDKSLGLDGWILNQTGGGGDIRVGDTLEILLLTVLKVIQAVIGLAYPPNGPGGHPLI